MDIGLIEILKQEYILIYLGSNILIEDRRRLITTDRTDTYFCSKVLQQSYTSISIMTNNPINPPFTFDFGSEFMLWWL